MSEWKGKVVVLWFIYASCPDVCPLHTDDMVSVQEMINGTPMKDWVEFVAITTDPERDTNEVLRDSEAAHGLDPVNSVLLTSSTDRPAGGREVAEAYGLKFMPLPDGMLTHGVVTHVIDKSGNLRARYHGLKFDPTNLVAYINALTNDDHWCDPRRGTFRMMHDMMNGSGMRWGMGLLWLALIVALILGIASLVKYVFFR